MYNNGGKSHEFRLDNTPIHDNFGECNLNKAFENANNPQSLIKITWVVYLE